MFPSKLRTHYNVCSLFVPCGSVVMFMREIVRVRTAMLVMSALRVVNKPGGPRLSANEDKSLRALRSNG